MIGKGEGGRGPRGLFLLSLLEGLGEPVVGGGGGARAVVAAGGIVAVALWTIAGGAAALHVGLGFEAEGDAFADQIDFDDGGLDFLADFDDFGGIFDEGIAELADVDETILVDAYIDKGTEGGDVGDNAGEFHANLEVFGFFDAFLEMEDFELFAGVASGFGEFFDDVAQRRETDIGGDVVARFDLGAKLRIFEQLVDGAIEVGGHFFDEGVALGMNGGGIERMRGTIDAEESSGLLEGFFAEARNAF